MRLSNEKQLRAAKPNQLTPKDSPASSPETQALHALQFYMDGDVKNDIPALFMLMNALSRLHDEGVVATKLTERLARGICQRYSYPDRADKNVEIQISLVIDGEADDAQTVVESLLDNGVLQDAINEHDNDDVGELRVLSAVML